MHWDPCWGEEPIWCGPSGGRLSQYEVTPAQTHVLLYLCRCGGQALQGQVTEFLKVKPSTANGILDRMMDKGLITRTVSGSDAVSG